MNINLDEIEKIFCEDIGIGFSKEFFAMIMNPKHPEPLTFALSPEQSKRLLQHLASQVSEYEKRFGAIDAAWEPGIQSPIQISDVGGANGAGGKRKK